jgi:hypothetical protein
LKKSSSDWNPELPQAEISVGTAKKTGFGLGRIGEKATLPDNEVQEEGVVSQIKDA